MINDRTADTEVISTLKGEKIQMKIAEDALAHIMDMLTELYEDAELAIIREYSTNAWDAHVEAGVTRPIEISLPSHLSQFLKIRDYGAGLSIQDIQDIYSQYGKTTKDDSNDFTGSLGVGCKSALAYTSQFTFTSIKGGVKCIVSVSRDEDGLASMTVVDTSVTEEPSGVEITIPVKRFNAIEDKARELFAYWDEGTVLLNGKPPKRFGGLELSTNVFLVDGSGYDHRIVMGGVSYPAKFDRYQIGILPEGYSIVAFVDIGDVHFVPSREALKYTRKTKECMANIEQLVLAKTTQAIIDDISKAEDHFEAVKKSIHWWNIARKALREEAVMYHDEPIPRNISLPSHTEITKDEDGNSVTTQYREYAYITEGGTRRLGKASKLNSIDISYLANSYFVFGYDKVGNFSAYTKKKLHQYCNDNGLPYPNHFVLTKSKLDSIWVNDSGFIDYETIKSIKIPRPWNGASSVNRKVKGTYNLWINHNFSENVPADDIDTSKPLYYYAANKFSDAAKSYLNILTSNVGEFTVAEMGANRINKFKRDFPMAKSLIESCETFFKTWRESIDEDDIKALYIQNRMKNLRNLRPGDIDDPNLYIIVGLAHRNVDNLLKTMRLYNPMGSVNLYEYRIEDPLDKYPLIDIYSLDDVHPHTYLYLNAAYAADKGKVN